MAVNTLAQSLGTAKPPVASLLTGDITQRGKTSQKDLPGMLERSYEAEEASQRAKIGAEQGQIQREAEALEGSAQQLRQETERVRGLEQPYQEFQAPQYTAADYAKGAATRALTAVILGGVAKTSAMTQLKAIKAMQDAERDGRTQDFEAARLTFDEAEKKRVDFNQRLKRDLDDFEKLLQTDTKAALVKAKLIGAETQDAMVKALIDKQRYGDAIKLARDQIDTADKLAMQREQQAARVAEAAARETAKGTGQKVEKLKMTAQPEARLSGARESIEAILSIEERLKKPGVSEALQNSQFLRTLIEKPTELFSIEKFVRTKLYENLPKEVKELFVIIAQARNDYYRQQSGQAVTGPEAARNFFAVIQPTDNAAELLLKSNALKPKFIRQLEDFESDYELGPGTQQRVRDLVSRAKASAEDQSGVEDKRLSAPQPSAQPAQPTATQPSEPKPLTEEERRRLNELRERARQRAGSGQ